MPEKRVRGCKYCKSVIMAYTRPVVTIDLAEYNALREIRKGLDADIADFLKSVSFHVDNSVSVSNANTVHRFAKKFNLNVLPSSKGDGWFEMG